MANNWYAALRLFETTTTTSPYATLARGISKSLQSYSFPTDSRGRTVLPTMETLEKATDPASKLAVAGQLADVVKIQADAATRTGLTNRVADMTNRAEQVLDAVSAVVNQLKTKDGSVATGEADPALEPYEKALARVLGTLRSTLAEISNLLPKAKKDVATQTGKKIDLLDVRGSGLASLAGLVWKPLPTAGGSGSTSSAAGTDPTKTLDILV